MPYISNRSRTMFVVLGGIVFAGVWLLPQHGWLWALAAVLTFINFQWAETRAYEFGGRVSERTIYVLPILKPSDAPESPQFLHGKYREYPCVDLSEGLLSRLLRALAQTSVLPTDEGVPEGRPEARRCPKCESLLRVTDRGPWCVKCKELRWA